MAEAASKARAENLVEEIERLTSQRSSTEKTSEATDEQNETSDKKTTSVESPGEFIHRRMRELDQRKKP
jgi:hypothetical protein